MRFSIPVDRKDNSFTLGQDSNFCPLIENESYFARNHVAMTPNQISSFPRNYFIALQNVKNRNDISLMNMHFTLITQNVAFQIFQF